MPISGCALRQSGAWLRGCRHASTGRRRRDRCAAVFATRSSSNLRGTDQPPSGGGGVREWADRGGRNGAEGGATGAGGGGWDGDAGGRNGRGRTERHNHPPLPSPPPPRSPNRTRGYVGLSPQFAVSFVSRHQRFGRPIRVRSRASRTQLGDRQPPPFPPPPTPTPPITARRSSVLARALPVPVCARTRRCRSARRFACCRSQVLQKISDSNHRAHFSAVTAFSTLKQPLATVCVVREDGSGNGGA